MTLEMEQRITNFLNDTNDISPEQFAIVTELRELINSINPDAEQEIKYGGLVFNVGKELITGIFTRKKHISVEFSFGAGFADPEKLLEGSGKLRRHLKIVTNEHIQEKRVEDFVKIAFAASEK